MLGILASSTTGHCIKSSKCIVEIYGDVLVHLKAWHQTLLDTDMSMFIHIKQKDIIRNKRIINIIRLYQNGKICSMDSEISLKF